jgi:hypothetical protein
MKFHLFSVLSTRRAADVRHGPLVNLKGSLGHGHDATMSSTQAEDSTLENSASILKERRFRLSRYCFLG